MLYSFENRLVFRAEAQQPLSEIRTVLVSPEYSLRQEVQYFPPVRRARQRIEEVIDPEYFEKMQAWADQNKHKVADWHSEEDDLHRWVIIMGYKKEIDRMEVWGRKSGRPFFVRKEELTVKE